MGLDIHLMAMRRVSVASFNITHNLISMADAAGLYKPIWRPEENGIKLASELVEPLAKGIAMLRSDPAKFKRHEPSNGWGTYQSFVECLVLLHDKCVDNPDAEVEANR